MPNLMKCLNNACKQLVPDVQITADKARIVSSRCPKCGGELKNLGYIDTDNTGRANKALAG